MFGYQEPDAGQVTADLVGQPLPDAPFNAARITGLDLGVFASDTGLDGGLLLARGVFVEFFFEGLFRGRLGLHCGCC